MRSQLIMQKQMASGLFSWSSCLSFFDYQQSKPSQRPPTSKKHSTEEKNLTKHMNKEILVEKAYPLPDKTSYSRTSPWQTGLHFAHPCLPCKQSFKTWTQPESSQVSWALDSTKLSQVPTFSFLFCFFFLSLFFFFFFSEGGLGDGF